MHSWFDDDSISEAPNGSGALPTGSVRWSILADYVVAPLGRDSLWPARIRGQVYCQRLDAAAQRPGPLGRSSAGGDAWSDSSGLPIATSILSAPALARTASGDQAPRYAQHLVPHSQLGSAQRAPLRFDGTCRKVGAAYTPGSEERMQEPGIIL